MRIRKSSIIENALRDLKFVRYQLRRAGSKKAADYVCRAIKSTEGALRNAKRFEFQSTLSPGQTKKQVTKEQVSMK